LDYSNHHIVKTVTGAHSLIVILFLTIKVLGDKKGGQEWPEAMFYPGTHIRIWAYW
jgi:hypothetical protein